MRGNNLLKILSFIPGGLKCVSKILPRPSELLCHIGWIKIFFKKQKQKNTKKHKTNKQTTTKSPNTFSSQTPTYVENI